MRATARIASETAIVNAASAQAVAVAAGVTANAAEHRHDQIQTDAGSEPRGLETGREMIAAIDRGEADRA